MEDVVVTVGNAIGKLAAASGSASFAQVANSQNLATTIQSLTVVMDAASFSNTDRQKLVALVQSHQESDDDDSLVGAPAAATYEKKSGNIVDILEDMKDKAEGQLSDLRKAEQTAKHNYERLKGSIDDQVANDNSNMEQQKKAMAAAQEGKAAAEGDLEVTVADIKSSSDALATTQKDCMTVATDHEAAVRAMNDELKVLALQSRLFPRRLEHWCKLLSSRQTLELPCRMLSPKSPSSSVRLLRSKTPDRLHSSPHASWRCQGAVHSTRPILSSRFVA
jgi:hypothetical protein